MKLANSFSFRLSVTHIVLFAGSVALIGGVYYWLSVAIPLNAAKNQVRVEAARLAHFYEKNGREALIQQLTARARRPAARKAFHALITPDGKVLSANILGWPKAPARGWVRLEADLYWEGGEDDHEALVLDYALPDGTRLMVGRDIDDIDDREETLKSGAAWILGVTILLGAIGGAFMSVAIGRRIDAVSTAARRVIGGDLSGRVPVFGSGDDFDRLGETLNLMLSRIEELVESVRRVSDNVAHELRTPLARLRADLEDLASVERSLDQQTRLTAAIGEVERLESIFAAILRIARIENRSEQPDVVELDLSAILADAAELYEVSAEEKQIAFSTSIAPGLTVSGDSDLIFQAICNLLDNAIKYTPPGGNVALLAGEAAEYVVITITDSGPGIPASERDRVTERFYRIASTAGAAGAGLGLSLVSAVAARHGSTIVLGDDSPGLRVTWSFRGSGI